MVVTLVETQGRFDNGQVSRSDILLVAQIILSAVGLAINATQCVSEWHEGRCTSSLKGHSRNQEMVKMTHDVNSDISWRMSA